MVDSAAGNECVAGNYYDKYGTRNPIARYLMSGFTSDLDELAAVSACSDVHEIGCGEGNLSIRLTQHGLTVRGSDYSPEVISLARRNASAVGSEIPFKAASIYELTQEEDSAELIICCEVLEHLESPERALKVIQQLAQRHVIFSVPREPLWRILNMARGKYLKEWGNTPGHVQHWSKAGFIAMIEKYFEIIEIRSPLPWTMLLCRPLAESVR